MGRSIALDAVLVVLGEESLARFMATIMVMAIGESIYSMGVLNMEALIFLPEGMFVWTVLVLTVAGILGPVASAFFMKDESSHANEPWKGKYIMTMVLDFFVAPLGGLVLASWIVQNFSLNVNDIFYEILLFFCVLGVAYFALSLMNRGITATANQFKKLLGEANDAVKDIKE